MFAISFRGFTQTILGIIWSEYYISFRKIWIIQEESSGTSGIFLSFSEEYSSIFRKNVLVFFKSFIWSLLHKNQFNPVPSYSKNEFLRWLIPDCDRHHFLLTHKGCIIFSSGSEEEDYDCHSIPSLSFPLLFLHPLFSLSSSFSFCLRESGRKQKEKMKHERIE